MTCRRFLANSTLLSKQRLNNFFGKLLLFVVHSVKYININAKFFFLGCEGEEEDRQNRLFSVNDVAPSLNGIVGRQACISRQRTTDIIIISGIEVCENCLYLTTDRHGSNILFIRNLFNVVFVFVFERSHNFRTIQNII